MNDDASTYTITRDGEKLPLKLTSTLAGLPNAMFAASEHYGSGEYVASTDGSPVFRLTTEWCE